MAWIWALALASAFTAVQLTQSYVAGKFLLPPSYDDISYLFDGARRLLLIFNDGLGAGLADVLRSPFHSPMSVLFAMLGLALTGFRTWGPYLLNGFVLAAIIRLFFYVGRELPASVLVPLTMALLGFPLLGVVIIEFRPDAICALLSAIGVVWISLRPWIAATAWTDRFLPGILLGLALLAKPAIFHVTLPLFGLATTLKTLGALREGVSYRTIAYAWARTLGLGLLIASPHYAIALPAIVEYIYVNTLGKHGALWRSEMPFAETALFYVTGRGGRFGMGPWYVPWLIAVPAAIAVTLSRRGRQLGAVATAAVVMLAAYLVVTIPPNKTHFIGLIVPALVLCTLSAAALYLLTALTLRRRMMLAYVLVLGLVVFSAGTFAFPWQQLAGPQTASSQIYARSQWKIVNKIVETIAEHNPGVATVAQMSTAGYSAAETIGLLTIQRGYPVPTFISIDHYSGGSSLLQHVRDATIVIAATPDMGALPTWLPTTSPQFRAEVLEAARSQQRLRLVETIPDQVNGGAFLIFAEDPPFSNVQVVSGLGPLEGPYPQHRLPMFRAARDTSGGTLAETKLIAQGQPLATGTLTIDGRIGDQGGQEIKIVIGGEERQTFGLTAEFQKVEVPFQFDQNGRAEVTLRYSRPTPTSALFRRISVR